MIGNIVAGTFSAGVAPVTSSYESIATVSVGSGGTGSIDFTSIPSTYKHLQIRAHVACNQQFANLKINNDGGNSYSYHWLYGNGSSATSAGASSVSPSDARLARTSGSSSAWGSFVTDILDYTSTSKYKTVRTLSGWDNNGSGELMFISDLYFGTTDAVNRITLIANASGSFAQYSHFALYGIKD